MSADRGQRKRRKLMVRGSGARVGVCVPTGDAEGHIWRLIEAADVDLKLWEANGPAEEPFAEPKAGTLEDAAVLLVVIPPGAGPKLDGPGLTDIRDAVDELLKGGTDV